MIPEPIPAVFDPDLVKAVEAAHLLDARLSRLADEAGLGLNEYPTVEVSWTPATLAVCVRRDGGETCLRDDQNCHEEDLTFPHLMAAFHARVRALAALFPGDGA